MCESTITQHSRLSVWWTQCGVRDRWSGISFHARLDQPYPARCRLVPFASHPPPAAARIRLSSATDDVRGERSVTTAAARDTARLCSVGPARRLHDRSSVRRVATDGVVATQRVRVTHRRTDRQTDTLRCGHYITSMSASHAFAGRQCG